MLGASGYTGSECVRLLLRHPHVEIALLTADRRAGQEMRDVFPQFSPYDLPKLVAIEALGLGAAGIDLVFCALPHATTQKVIKDLSAAGAGHQGGRPLRRFPARRHGGLCAWYGHEHHAPELQKEAVYGLVEIYRSEIKTARLVANPGCYTTCAQLPLVPLLRREGDRPDEIVIDAKSGMTGARARGQGGDAVLGSVGRASTPMASAITGTWPNSIRNSPRPPGARWS